MSRARAPIFSRSLPVRRLRCVAYIAVEKGETRIAIASSFATASGGKKCACLTLRNSKSSRGKDERAWRTVLFFSRFTFRRCLVCREDTRGRRAEAKLSAELSDHVSPVASRRFANARRRSDVHRRRSAPVE